MKNLAILSLFMLSWSGYTALPDPLIWNGSEISSLESWSNRKDEILEYAQKEVYGDYPSQFTLKIDSQRAIESHGFSGTEFIFTPFENESPKNFKLDVITLKPEHEIKKALIFHHKFKSNEEFLRTQNKTFRLTENLEQGILIIIFPERLIKTDSSKKYDFEIAQLYSNEFFPNPPGQIMSWAWGLAEVANNLSAVYNVPFYSFGHSRRGKSAILAAAFSDSIKGVVSHMSGCGGSTPLSNFENDGIVRETGSLMVKGSPIYIPTGEKNLGHFFNKKFNENLGKVNSEKYEQNLLMAALFPKSIIDIRGSRDFWSGPKAARKSNQSAKKVFDKFGKSENFQSLSITQLHLLTHDSWKLIWEVL